jgi:serine/threonine-protein kinase
MPDRLAALAQIADALDYAHRCGIVHCDVKPSNILVSLPFSARGAVLIDFGVAHAVAEDVGRRPAHVEASLPYSAPELLHGHAPSAATDEYALACTAFELITGSPPFTATTSMELVDEQLHAQPPKVSRKFDWLRHGFDSIMAKALSKSPDNRYESCSEFVSLIAKTLE